MYTQMRAHTYTTHARTHYIPFLVGTHGTSLQGHTNLQNDVQDEPQRSFGAVVAGNEEPKWQENAPRETHQ